MRGVRSTLLHSPSQISVGECRKVEQPRCSANFFRFERGGPLLVTSVSLSRSRSKMATLDGFPIDAVQNPSPLNGVRRTSTPGFAASRHPRTRSSPRPPHKSPPFVTLWLTTLPLHPLGRRRRCYHGSLAPVRDLRERRWSQPRRHDVHGYRGP